MSNYIKTIWAAGDLITATKMNNLETGIEQLDQQQENIIEASDALKAVCDSMAPRIAAMEAIIAANPARDWQTIQRTIQAGLGPVAYPIGTQFQVKRATAVSAALGTHTGITDVSVDEETFLSEMGNVGSGVHTFIFQQGVWQYDNAPVDLTDYGITITGTAAAGDEIIITETYQTILFDVVDHRTITDPVTNTSKPGMVLLMHNVIGPIRYSQKEAVYYAETGLTAGAYCFTVAGQSWYSADNGKTYYFTLTQSIPVGGQIVMNHSAFQALEGKTVSTYSGPASTTEIESATLSETAIADATSLGTTNGVGGMNHFGRISYGSNNYSTSNPRAFINSDAGVDEWWEPVGVYDRPPASSGLAGLLYGMDADFVNAVGATDIPCAKGVSWDEPGADSDYTLLDKFFAPSRVELGGSGSDGSVFALYAEAQNADRIKRDITAMATARMWCTRTPASNSFNLPRVRSNGEIGSETAVTSSYVAAACVIY